MLKIFYTLKENMDEMNNPIDDTLIESMEGTLEDEATLGDDYIIISRWDLVDYNNMMEKSLQENKDNLSNIVKEYVDGIAQSLRYDSIEAISKYIGFENPFKDECIRLAEFNAKCWFKAIEIEGTLTSSMYVIKEDIIPLLPTFN